MICNVVGIGILNVGVLSYFLLRYKKSHIVTIEVIEKILIFKYFNIRVGGIIIFSDVSYHNFIQLSLSM